MKPPCNLPYPSLEELFIGRGPFLVDLRRRFEQARLAQPNAWPNHAVPGMAGAGKTRLAIEYGWKHKQDYTALLFVNGESPASLGRGLVNLAGVLVADLKADTRVPDKRAAVLAWLKAHSGWLLIVDNVDDQSACDDVNRYLNDWHNGHVLITGRYGDWGQDVERLDLHVLSQEDATDFLLKSTTSRQQRPSDPAVAEHVAGDLGFLCLALEQCAAYVNRQAISLAEYRRRWQANVNNVHGWADKVLMDDHEAKAVSLSIATTWQTTMDALSAPARELLQTLCWLAVEPLPLTLFDVLEEHGESRAEAMELPEELAGNMEEMVAELRSYSLLQGPLECGFATPGRMHRLVQLATRAYSNLLEKHTGLQGALNALDDVFNDESARVHDWPVLDSLAAHLDEALRHGDALGITTPVARLMSDLALLYQQQGRFQEAEGLYRRALAIHEQPFGEPDPDYAAHLNNLAQSLEANNHSEAAEPLRYFASKIDGQSSGKDYLTITDDLNNLAQLLMVMDRFKEVEPLKRRVADIFEKHLGKDHPTVAIALDNLAQLLEVLDRFEEAEPLRRRALAIDEQSFGKDHPRVASDLNKLAWLLEDTDRPAEAEPLYRRALAIDEQLFGKDHPRVAIDLNKLAQLLVGTNRCAEAEPLMRRALVICATGLGDEHPCTPAVRRDYIELLEALGKTEAEIDAALTSLSDSPPPSPN